MQKLQLMLKDGGRVTFYEAEEGLGDRGASVGQLLNTPGKDARGVSLVNENGDGQDVTDAMGNLVADELHDVSKRLGFSQEEARVVAAKALASHPWLDTTMFPALMKAFVDSMPLGGNDAFGRQWLEDHPDGAVSPEDNIIAAASMWALDNSAQGGGFHTIFVDGKKAFDLNWADGEFKKIGATLLLAFRVATNKPIEIDEDGARVDITDALDKNVHATRSAMPDTNKDNFWGVLGPIYKTASRVADDFFNKEGDSK